MELSSLMVWCKLIEEHQIDFPEKSSTFFNNLHTYVESTKIFEEDDRDMSNKKYLGRIGQNTFEFALKKKNTPNGYSSKVIGERIKGSENDKVDLTIVGINQNLVRSFFLMYLSFSAIVLWPDFNLGDIMFLIIGFCTFSLILTLFVREQIKYIKKQLAKDFLIQF